MSQTLFILSRERERAAVGGAVLSPASREVIYEMIDAVWTARDNGRVTDAELAPILKGLTLPEEAVWARAGRWLARLVDFSPGLTSLVDELVSHQDETMRYRICVAFEDRHFPDALIWPRLKRLLADQSSRVRTMAVRICIKRQNHRMLPALEAAADSELDGKDRERIQMAIALIRGAPFWLGDIQHL